jgi:hypothetical protein
MVKTRMMRWVGHVTRMGRRGNIYVIGGKARRKRPLGRPRCRWGDTIKMDLGGIGWGGMDWIGLAQDRDQWKTLVNTVMSIRIS